MSTPGSALQSGQELLQDLKRQGIELYPEDGMIRFRAPKAAFTPELRELVRSRKQELLAILESSEAPEAVCPIPPCDRSAPVRMSSCQERIWFLYRFEGPSSTYNITPVFRLRGSLSLDALRSAFNALLWRHESLRTRFREQDGIGVQIVDEPGEVGLEIVSLSHLPAAERMAAVERIILEKTAQPFDLENGPLLHVTLIVVDSADHVLLPFMHHIIGDGWSLGVLHREFALLYDGFVSGHATALAPLTVQYSDYSAWQRERLGTEETRNALAYWRRQLAGAPQTLALPLDFERPAQITFNGRVLRRIIPAELVQSLAKLGRERDCTIFMVLLAAYGVLLHRHSGQDDILIGSPVAGRMLRETEALIGCFVNTLVLRIQLRGNPAFTEILEQVRRTALDAYSHQDVPVEAVIDAVVQQRDPGRIPLYQTQFSLQNVPTRGVAVSTLNVEVMPMDRVAAKNDLSFILENRVDGILAELEFNCDLFREETVSALGDDYACMLQAISDSPERCIMELPLTSRPAASVLDLPDPHLIEQALIEPDFPGSAAVGDLDGTFSIDVKATSTLSQDRLSCKFAGLLSAVAVYLWKYSGRDVFTLSTDGLPIRVDMTAGLTFGELRRRCEQALRDAHAQRTLVLPMSVMIASAEPQGRRGTLAIEFAEDDACRIRYSSRHFRTRTVARLAGDLERILETCLPNPEVSLGSISLLGPAETHKFLRGTTLTESAAAGDAQDLASAFEAAVASGPAIQAVRDSRETLTYAELNRRAESIAAQLVALDLPPESPVGLYMDRSVNLIAAILGVLKAGAAWLPLDRDHPVDRLLFMLAHAGARVVLSDAASEPRAVDLVASQGIRVLAVADQDTAPSPALKRRAINANQLAYIIFTSGSTGRPKGVMVEHRSVLNLIQGLQDAVYRDLNEHLQVALIASPVFDASIQQIFAALLHGHTLCLVDEELRRDGEQLCRRLHEWAIDVCDCTPSLLSIMLHGGFADSCRNMRHLLVGGEPLPASLMKELYASESARGILVTNVYGPTECCVDVLCMRVDPAAFSTQPAGPATVPIGRAMHNCIAFVVDRQGWPVPAGVPGELVIAGVCLARGYVNDPDLTAARFGSFPAFEVSRGYRTGDLCRYDDDGIFEFLGRNDDQVKILGHRIELGEVESHLRMHPAIGELTVQVRPSSGGDRELVAWLVPKSPVTVAELREFAAARMPAYMVPAYFVTLASLPLNSSGKVARQALPAPEEGMHLASGIEYAGPETAAQRILHDVWTRTLQLSRIGIRDNYFASGGDSIKALQVAARVRQAGWSLEVRDIFQHPTIEQLALLIRPLNGSPAQKSEPAFTGHAPLSAIQQFFFSTYGAAPEFNQAVLLRPLRRLEPKRLHKALGLLAEHHEMLRCRFVEREGVWSQEVLPPGAVQPILQQVDLSCDPEAGRTLATWNDQAQSSFDLGRAPLWSAALYEMPDGQRLLLSAHHLIVDGVSWRILLEQLEQLLEQQQLPARSAPYPAWVASQRAAVRTVLTEEGDYWPSLDSPACEPALDSNRERRRELHSSLSKDLTRSLLTEAHHAYSTEINDLLIAAVVLAWRSWSGSSHCALTLEGHGREPFDPDMDISQTIGWFTSIFPVHVALPDGSAPGEAIQSVRKTLRAIPRKGAGYSVLRYLTDDDVVTSLSDFPPIAFNYLGGFDSVGGVWFERAPEPGPVTAASTLPMPWPLEITAAVVDGRMELSLAWDADRFDVAGVEQFFQGITAEIRNIVDHTLGRNTPEPAESEAFPLTPLQEGMFFHAQAHQDSDAYFEQWSIRLRGDLRPDLVRAAWNELSERHDIFRSVFTPGDGKRPLQTTLRRREIEVKTLNLSAIPEAEQLARLQMEREADRSQGFRLDAEPLVRLLLVELAHQEWEIVWSHHHIIMDGWSVGVVQAEFIRIYSAKYTGRNAVLSAPPSPFRSFVRALPQTFDDGFWKDYLSGYRTAVDLPRSRSNQKPELARHVTQLSLQATGRLHGFCRTEGVTLSSVLQAVWGLLLARYTCSDDVIFGYVFSGRPADQPDVERMVGLFINTLPIRVKFRDSENFRQLVTRLHRTGAELTARQLTSLVWIQRLCGNGGPLFHHVVALENYPIEEQLRQIDKAETGFETVSMASYDRTHYDFDLAILPGRDVIQFRFSYDKSIYDADLMERIGQQLAYVIDQLLDRPDQDPRRVNILPPRQWQAVVEAPNRTKARYPQTATIPDLFDAQAAARPDEPALLAPDRSNQWLTYGEVQTRANVIARHLRDDLSIAPGSRIGICLPPSAQSIIAVLGVLKASCTYVPVDPEYPRERVQFILNDSGARALLTTAEVLHLLPDVGGPVVNIDDLASPEQTEAPPSASQPDDVAYVIYTSGSTGLPKGCEVTHRNVARLILNDRFDFDIGASDVWIMAHSLCFDFSVWEIFGALLRGGRLVIPARETVRNVPAFRDLLHSCRVTILNQTPLAFYSLIAVEENAPVHDMADHLRYVIFGGDRLDPAALLPWTRHYPLSSVALVNMYGITETTVHVTFCELTHEDLVATAHHSPIGRPLPETAVYVCDPYLNPQPPGAPGEMLIGGTGVCKGYLNRPELTAERFIPDIFSGAGLLYRSGDLGCFDASGRLSYLGRNDHQVKIRGHRIEPAEVERALMAVQGIARAVVLPEQGPAGTELTAWLTGAPDLETLRTQLEQHLPEYMIPTAFVLCEAFPVTENGKLDRKALRSLRTAATRSRALEFAPPETDRERTLASIWEAVLGVEHIGRNDRYLTLGGDSIKSIQILARLRTAGLNLELKDLFRYQTVAELAPRLTSLKQAASAADSGLPFGLTPIQRRYFTEHPAEPAHFNHSVLLRSVARCNDEHLRRALQVILDTHGSLRLRFEHSDQRIEPPAQPVQFSVVDLSSEKDAGTALLHHSQQEQQGMDLSAGPIFRSVLYRMPDADRLLLLAHHLAVDGITWRILQDDLIAVLEQCSQGNAISLPPVSITLSRWSSLLHDPALHRRLATELPFWMRMDDPSGCGGLLLRDGRYRYSDAAEEAFEWDEVNTLDLRRACTAYQNNVGELLLTALGTALRLLTGASTFQVALEGHGRDGLAGCDVSRTAGWFTALYPFRLNAEDLPPGRLITEIKEDLRRVPSGGIGYGILRYLSSIPDASRLQARPHICFNYLGEFSFRATDGWMPSAEPIGASVSPRQVRPFALEAAAVIVNGRLRFSLIFVPAQLETGEILRLRDAVAEQLRILTDHCLGRKAPELTPSDLTYKDLSIEELEGIFEN